MFSKLKQGAKRAAQFVGRHGEKVLAAGAMVGVASANAAIDTTAVVSSITDGQTAATTVALAMAAAVVGLKAIHLIKRS